MFERLFTQQLDEDTLVKRAKENERYFGRLYERYVDLVYRFVRRRVASDQDAEDIVSQTFMAVAARIQEYDTSRDQKFSTWLLAIANYKFLDYMRAVYKEKEHTKIVDEDFDPGYEQDFAKLLTQQELYDQIIEFAKTSLSDRQSSIFFLRYVEGYRNKEIAEICDIKEKTVSSNLSKAVKKVKKHVKALNRTTDFKEKID